jgi:hypothetical protein
MNIIKEHCDREKNRSRDSLEVYTLSSPSSPRIRRGGFRNAVYLDSRPFERNVRMSFVAV